MVSNDTNCSLGAVGWALQVPQNNELIKARELQGDGNLAVALNESALYLGSAIGAAMGGILLLQNLSPWLLAATAGVVAGLGAFIQFVNIKSMQISGNPDLTRLYLLILYKYLHVILINAHDIIYKGNRP